MAQPLIAIVFHSLYGYIARQALAVRERVRARTGTHALLLEIKAAA
jgi:hypothetical protein